MKLILFFNTAHKANKANEKIAYISYCNFKMRTQRYMLDYLYNERMVWNKSYFKIYNFQKIVLFFI